MREKRMVSEKDIAWLAGIVDGEGCFAVKRPIVRQTYQKGKLTSFQVWLVVCNTSEPMMRRMVAILDALGVEYPAMRRVWKGKRATRWQFWVHVQKKHALLRITDALLPHLTAKKDEAEVVAWFLRRACAVKAYRPTPLDRLALESLSQIKRNGGEAPAEMRELLREVIPSQAAAGRAIEHGAAEGVEARIVSPDNKRSQECPAATRSN